MYYKYEMHCHDRIVSACAHSYPEEVVTAYAGKGYAGLVFTNHFLGGYHAVNQNLHWNEQIDVYYNAYLRGKAAAPKGFTVLFGIEHRYGNQGKEVLTYGVTPEFLKAHENLHLLPLREYSALVRGAGGFLCQAHPYRNGRIMRPDIDPKPELIDAVEVYNFFNTAEENAKAAAFAEKHGICQMSGGDIHDIKEDLGLAGMAFPYPILNSRQLVAALKKHDGRLIVHGEIL